MPTAGTHRCAKNASVAALQEAELLCWCCSVSSFRYLAMPDVVIVHIHTTNIDEEYLLCKSGKGNWLRPTLTLHFILHKDCHSGTHDGYGAWHRLIWASRCPNHLEKKSVDIAMLIKLFLIHFSHNHTILRSLYFHYIYTPIGWLKTSLAFFSIFIPHCQCLVVVLHLPRILNTFK